MSQEYIPADARRSVAEAARYRCGYCLTSQAIVAIPMHYVVPSRRIWVAAGWHPPID